MAADRGRSDAWSGASTGWAVLSTMIGGIAVWGGLGYLADRWLGTAHVFFTVGVLVGAAGAMYLIWLRYGRSEGGGS
jgi:F0F1-type ATP synthase assembly protein I